MTPTSDPVYCFVVTEVGERPEDRRFLQLDIRPHDELAGTHYRNVWNKLAQAVTKRYELGGDGPAPGWTAWKPWDWCDMVLGYEKRQKHVAWNGNELVGFLNVWPDFPCHHQPQKLALYVEHVAAFPGNLHTTLWRRRFAHVGIALMAYAVLLSIQQGFKGRLGLHVADEAALGFYRRLNSLKGGALFHPKRAV